MSRTLHLSVLTLCNLNKLACCLPEPAEPSSRTSNKAKSTTKVVLDPKQQFVETQFSDPTAKFYCRIYFPDEFRQLRSAVFPYGEDR